MKHNFLQHFRLRNLILLTVHCIAAASIAGPIAFRAQEAIVMPEIVGASYIDRIHQGDVIEIQVSGYLEFNWSGSLTPEGFLDGYDRVANPVFAQCRSISELEKEIDGYLSKTLRNPKTEVRIIDRSRRPFATIDGAIRTPQRMQLRRVVRLNEIVVNAGGFTDRTSGQVIISRPAGASCIGDAISSTNERFDIALADLLAGRPESNPLIVSGDLIVVIEASPVYLLGAIQVQGRIDFRPELTVSRAIDAAGGLEKSAVPQDVKIFRRDGGSSMIAVDVAKIRSKESLDVILRPFDIIDVPYKGKPPRKLPPMIDNEAENRERRAKLPVKIIE